MKKTDIIIFSLCIGFFMIAIYETFMYGISYSYWWLMVSVGLLLLYSFRRRSREENEEKQNPKKPR